MHTLNVVVGLLGTIFALALVGWGLVYSIRTSYDPVKMVFKIAFTIPFLIVCIWFALKMGPFGPFLIVFMAVVLTPIWAPHLGEMVASPLSSLFDGGREPPEPKPFYSVAMTKRNRGKPREAVLEVRKQLERFPHDFEGIMLLARIQAEDLSDLPGAEQTLDRFCEWKDAPLKQVTAAFGQVADWYIKLNGDVDSARSTLQKVVAKYPNTEVALIAEQRIAHLVEAHKVVLAQQDRQNVVVPQGVQNLGLLDSMEFIKPAEIEPGKLAAAHVKHLQEHPHDTEVRERLALIYARDFKRLDMATLELAQLINEPKHKPKQVAHWLNLLANLQVELGADLATVRGTLEKIVERFPDLPVADLANNRIARLENEFRGQRQGSSVKLGEYEQNIGLKYGRPGPR